jgi:hypothetical protein
LRVSDRRHARFQSARPPSGIAVEEVEPRLAALLGGVDPAPPVRAQALTQHTPRLDLGERAAELDVLGRREGGESAGSDDGGKRTREHL